MILREIINIINKYADEKKAMDWDNSGLQIGDPGSEITRALVCLDVTDAVIDEAVRIGAELVISHHPLLFRPLRHITDDPMGRLVKKIMAADINVYSSHTCFDMCGYGMNAYCAFRMGVETDSYLEETGPDEGIGICGDLREATTFAGFCSKVKTVFDTDILKVSAFCDDDTPIRRVAFCSGAGSDYIKRAKELGAQVYLTSDVSNSRFLEARDTDMPLVTLTHYESEKSFIRIMADILRRELTDVFVTESSQGDLERYI